MGISGNTLKKYYVRALSNSLLRFRSLPPRSIVTSVAALLAKVLSPAGGAVHAPVADQGCAGRQFVNAVVRVDDGDVVFVGVRPLGRNCSDG